jgi:hypothetical protein
MAVMNQEAERQPIPFRLTGRSQARDHPVDQPLQGAASALVT